MIKLQASRTLLNRRELSVHAVRREGPANDDDLDLS